MSKKKNPSPKSVKIPEELFAKGASGAAPKIEIPKISAETGQGADMTVARMLGEIVWIMTQSPGHKHFALGDLEWMVMPALALEQYRIFRNGTQPLGVAFWAYLNEDAEKKLLSGGSHLRPDEWAVGMKIDPEDGISAKKGGTLWLVDLICPFHTPKNKFADQMLADMIQGPFKGKKFKFHHTDPETGERKVMELGG